MVIQIQALDDYYMSRKETFDRIYDDMVRVRTQAAKKLGYSSFTELGFQSRYPQVHRSHHFAD